MCEGYDDLPTSSSLFVQTVSSAHTNSITTKRVLLPSDAPTNIWTTCSSCRRGALRRVWLRHLGTGCLHCPGTPPECLSFRENLLVCPKDRLRNYQGCPGRRPPPTPRPGKGLPSRNLREGSSHIPGSLAARRGWLPVGLRSSNPLPGCHLRSHSPGVSGRSHHSRCWHPVARSRRRTPCFRRFGGLLHVWRLLGLSLNRRGNREGHEGFRH